MRFRVNLQSITHAFISTSLVISMIYAIGSCYSCSLHDSETNSDLLRADSVIAKQYDSLFVDPASAILRLARVQQRFTDSIAFYRLELY